jgi:hypothetical protein
MNLADMESSSPYEQENKDPSSKMGTKTSYELVAYTKPLQAGQVDPYILEIRRRLKEDIHARREREKRRRKVLVDQLRALEAIEVSQFHSLKNIIRHVLKSSRILNVKNHWSVIYFVNLNLNGVLRLNYYKLDMKKIFYVKIVFHTKNNWKFVENKILSKLWIEKL